MIKKMLRSAQYGTPILIPADFRKLPGYDRAWNAAAIVSDQLRAGMGWSEDRAEELKAQGATTLPKEQPPTKP